MTTSVVKVNDLSKTYGAGDTAVYALKKINLEIQQGDFVAIMGASGSGKSTLMNILGCLDAPTAGNYWIRNLDVERRRRAAEALTAVGLADRMEHQPHELSGGQQQRVAIARALVTEPAMVLADEPTGALDTASTNEILELLHELNRKGTTVVVITHEEEVARAARRVIRLRDGEIIEDRTWAA